MKRYKHIVPAVVVLASILFFNLIANLDTFPKLIHSVGSLKGLVLDQLNNSENVAAVSLGSLAMEKKVQESTASLFKAKTDIEMERYAKARSEELLALAKKDPKLFLSLALPKKATENFPAKIAQYIEKEETVEGTLEVVHYDDFDTNISIVENTLITQSGERVALYYGEKEPRIILGGSKVKVRGMKLQNTLVAESQDTSVEIVEEVLPGHTVKKVAVILFNFSNSTSQPWSVATAKDVVYKTVANYFNESSFGNLQVVSVVDPTGDVFGWYTIPNLADGTCNYSTWASAARTIAAQNGFVASNYTNVVFGFPGGSTGCGWSGLAYLPGSYSWAKSFTARVVAHELGHNFGMHHSSSYSCTKDGVRVSIGGSCTSGEYGDPFDNMGGGTTKHPNNFQKGHVNWFTSGNTLTVSSSGRYTIYPVEKSTSNTLALRIPRDVSSTGSVTNYYYLEFRQPFGFDNFSSTSPVVKGVSIRLAPGYPTTRQPWLIDATPETTGFSDAPLLPGKTFIDPEKGIQVTVVEATNLSATVDVVFTPPPCVEANPKVSVSPASQWGLPGQALSYNVSVTNMDSYTCSSSSFIVSSVVPQEWLQTPSAFTLTANPGQVVSRSISVTPLISTTEGTYKFTETAVKETNTAYSGFGTATHNILPVETILPTVSILTPIDGIVLPDKGTLKIQATASDASGIAKIELILDGVVFKLCANTTTCQENMSLRNVLPGTHIITARATDKAPIPNIGEKTISVLK